MYKETEPLYKTIVTLRLEYGIQAWRSNRKNDIDMLERVQRRVTKMIPKLRLRDQILFKILNGYKNIDRNILFLVKGEKNQDMELH